MRAVSLRSLKTADERPEAGRSGAIPRTDSGLRNVDFTDFIEQSLKKFECPVSVSVAKEVQREILPVKTTTSYKRKNTAQELDDTVSRRFYLEATKLVDEHTLLIMTGYDAQDQLIEITMNDFHFQAVPRIVMQLIALKVKYSAHLKKFTIKQCRMDMYTIHELNKILLATHITDVCLDHSPVKEGNYDLLLSDATKLRNLSLSRCNINDVVCERIASRLRFNEPAETNLMSLNLASNNISDVGMKSLGEALRSNRHLRYLNVSDNHITDDGARYVFEVLTEFPLTNEEIVDKGMRYIRYLRKKEILLSSLIQQLGKPDHLLDKKPSKKSTTARGIAKRSSKEHSSEEYLKKKAEAMVLEMLGPFKNPFCPSTVTERERQTYSIGNFMLCYLNLAYNNLTLISIQNLLAVVLEQKRHRKHKLSGLLFVLVEGNCLPAECDEYATIRKELHQARLGVKKQPGHNSTMEKPVPASR